MNNILLLWFTLIFVVVVVVLASEGDERPEFLKCLKNCPIECNLSQILKWTGWNCQDDCKYNCMQIDVQQSILDNKKMVQYYGKWPFRRLFGAQELFSVIFSMGNLIACLYGYFFIYLKGKRSGNDWIKRVHFASLLINCNTWLQSSIFHYRDTPLTEKLDYFSACLCILSSLPIILIRLFKIKTFKEQLWKVVAPFLIIYLQHIAYMSLVQFDYGYNIKFNATFGLFSNVLWIYWATCKQESEIIKKETLKFVTFNLITMSLVAIDFPPPFQLIDMHAIWHLCTIPVALKWYKLMRIIEEVESKTPNKED